MSAYLYAGRNTESRKMSSLIGEHLSAFNLPALLTTLKCVFAAEQGTTDA
jgi:hypothetical protein